MGCSPTKADQKGDHHDKHDDDHHDNREKMDTAAAPPEELDTISDPPAPKPRAFEWRVFLPHTSANASLVDHILSAVSSTNVKLEHPRTDKYFVLEEYYSSSTTTAGVGVKLAERDGKLSSEIKKLSRCLAHITAPFAHRLLPA